MATVSATWNKSSGDWFVDGNWNEFDGTGTDHLVPGSNNDVHFSGNSSSPGYVVTYTGTSTIYSLSSIGFVTLDMTSGSLELLNQSIFNQINVGVGTSLAIDSGSLTLGGAEISGNISGTTLNFTQGTYNIEAGAAIDTTMWNIGLSSGSSVPDVTFNTDLTYSGSLSLHSSAKLNLNSHTLTLSGTSTPSTLRGSVGDIGTLLVTGSANIDDFVLYGSTILEDAGSITNVGYLTLDDTSKLLIDSGATYTLPAGTAIADATNVDGIGTTEVVNKGTITVPGLIGSLESAVSISPSITNDGAITIASGRILSLGGGSSSFGGSISGAGTLSMDSGSYILAPDLSVSTAAWTVSFGSYANHPGGITLSSDLSYGGTFTDNATINLSGHTLSLSGKALLIDTIQGSGSVLATGTGDIRNLTLTQNASLIIGGTYTQDGNLVFADDTSQLVITDSGSLTINNSLMGNVDITSPSESDVGLSNAGYLTLEGHADLNTSIFNTGTINADASQIDFNGNTLTNDGSISVLSGATLNVYGNVTSDFGKHGTFDIDSNATLAIHSSIASNQTINFSPTGFGTLILTPYGSSSENTSPTITSFEAQISDFNSSDRIKLDDFSATSATFNNGVYTLSDGTTAVSLDFGNDQTESDLSFYTDSNGDTFVATSEAPCYCPGTMIATDRGDIAVEDLVIGDHVLTISGRMRAIKWIGRRDYSGRFILGRKDILPICIEAGALGDTVPVRDLWVSPHHAIYLDDILVEAKDLLNDVTIYQADVAEEVTYFHIELDSHDVILADGAWAESFIDDDNRGMFHNARHYSDLYGEEDNHVVARYCAPRLDCGDQVEAIRASINARTSVRKAA